MNKKLLNWIFVGQLILFGLIITGALAIYVLLSSLEDATVFFVRSIPFFLAIPITATFDNFNTWRIISAIIFLKWVIIDQELKIKSIYTLIRSYYNVNSFKKFGLPLLLILVTAILSIIPAPDKILVAKRIIYFLNLSLVGFVIYDLSKDIDLTKRLIKNISIPVIAV